MKKNTLLIFSILFLLVSCGTNKVADTNSEIKNKSIWFQLPADNTDQKNSSCNKEYISNTLSEWLPNNIDFKLTQNGTFYELAVTSEYGITTTAIICNDDIDAQLDRIIANATPSSDSDTDTSKKCPTFEETKDKIKSILPRGFIFKWSDEGDFYEIAVIWKDTRISTAINCNNYDTQLEEIIRLLPTQEIPNNPNTLSWKDSGDFIATTITYKDGEKESESIAKYDGKNEIYAIEGMIIHKPTGWSPYVYTRNSKNNTWEKETYITDTSAIIIGDIDFLPNNGKAAERLLSQSDTTVEKNQTCDTGMCDVYTSGRDEELIENLKESQAGQLNEFLSDPKYAKFLEGTALEWKTSFDDFIDEATQDAINTTYIDTKTGWVTESITDTIDLNDNLPVKVVTTFDYSKSVILEVPIN